MIDNAAIFFRIGHRSSSSTSYKTLARVPYFLQLLMTLFLTEVNSNSIVYTVSKVATSHRSKFELDILFSYSWSALYSSKTWLFTFNCSIPLRCVLVLINSVV